MSDSFSKIREYGKQSACNYGTEEFAYYMYGLVRMVRPNIFLEIGTGLGVTAFMVAQAMKENGSGKIITFDNGCQHSEEYAATMQSKIKEFKLEEHMDFRLQDFTFAAAANLPAVDIVFSDWNRTPRFISELISWVVTKTERLSRLYIDGAATDWPAYCVVEAITSTFNNRRIPDVICNTFEDVETLNKKITEYTLTVDHHIKNIGVPHQDSFTLVKVERNNIGYLG